MTARDSQSAEQLCEEKHAARAKRRYVRLRLLGAGSSCIVESHEAADMVKDDPELIATDAWLMPAEFEALPDFGGF